MVTAAGQQTDTFAACDEDHIYLSSGRPCGIAVFALTGSDPI